MKASLSRDVQLLTRMLNGGYNPGTIEIEEDWFICTELSELSH